MKFEKNKTKDDIEKSKKKFENDMAKEDFHILLQEKIKTDVVIKIKNRFLGKNVLKN